MSAHLVAAALQVASDDDSASYRFGQLLGRVLIVALVVGGLFFAIRAVRRASERKRVVEADAHRQWAQQQWAQQQAWQAHQQAGQTADQAAAQAAQAAQQAAQPPIPPPYPPQG